MAKSLADLIPFLTSSLKSATALLASSKPKKESASDINCPAFCAAAPANSNPITMPSIRNSPNGSNAFKTVLIIPEKIENAPFNLFVASSLLFKAF